MDQLQTRLDTLEQQMQHWQQQTRTVTRQLRWWRGLACSLLGLAVLTWALPLGTAQESKKSLEARVAALGSLLTHFSRTGDEVVITGANLHLVNGLGHTDCSDEHFDPVPDCPNGLGNLIVGYNERRPSDENVRTGSHNVVVGQFHNFSRVGGLVVGFLNEISADFAVVSGGSGNTASSFAAAVSGGKDNTASNFYASVSAGGKNTASGDLAAVSGGLNNTASGLQASVSGGITNTASSNWSSVSGGSGNTASGEYAVVSGGRERTAAGEVDWVAGDLSQEQ